MARIQLASNNDDIRGKIGNIVYGKGRSVHTQRKRVKPTNPQTSFQTRVRSLVSAFSSAWRSLTQDQMLSWNQLALQSFKSNVFGGKYHTTGHKLFIATNVNAALVEYTSTIYGPANPDHPHYSGAINTFTVSQGGPINVSIFLEEVIPTGAYLVVEATPMFSPGISAFKRKFVPIKVFKEGTTAGAKNITTEFTDRFGSLILGKKCAVRTRITWGADFTRESPSRYLTAIVDV